MRNTIEGLNGYAKDPAHEALAQPARRRVRGITAQPVFTALLLMTASIRKIRAWRARTARGKNRISRRARRRRASPPPTHLPDGSTATASRRHRPPSARQVSHAQARPQQRNRPA